MDIERRIAPLAFEVREEPGSGAPVVVGYAARFGVLSVDLGGFRETLAPGAFRNAIARSDVRYLVNHEGVPLARSTAGTLRLREDDLGLWVEADWPDTQQARDLRVSLARGDISQMSFAFTVAKDAWDLEARQRTITEVGELFDVSLVTYPAYPQTSAEARAVVAGLNRRRISPGRYRAMVARQRQMDHIVGGRGR